MEYRKNNSSSYLTGLEVVGAVTLLAVGGYGLAKGLEKVVSGGGGHHAAAHTKSVIPNTQY